MKTSDVKIDSNYNYGGVDNYGNPITQTTIFRFGESVKDWGVNPDYRSLLAQSMLWLRPNEYHHRQFRITLGDQQYILTAGSQQYLQYGCLAVPLGNYPQGKLSIHDELFNKCLSKMKDQINGTNFSVPMFLHDLKPTVAMFKNMVNLLKTQFYTIGVSPTKMAKAWLEYRYGWRLLCHDLYNGVKALDDMLTGGVHSRSAVRASSKSTRSSYQSYPGGFGIGMVQAQGAIHEYEEYFETRITLHYRSSPFGLDTMSQFGLTNPLSLLWDVIPYSFVIDWLLPVGDYLNSLDTFVGKTFLSGTVSYLTDSVCKTTPVNLVPYGSWRLASSQIKPAVGKYRSYHRYPLSAFPSARVPTIELNLNLNRTLDTLALIGQRIPDLVSAWQGRHIHTS